jgi:amino acid adenylation domain-containing protein/non-ribosomal peptide synthase protein (TIGR01720 family)
MKINKLLAMCADQSVQLNVNENKLEVTFDEYPTDELLAQLKINKESIVQYIIEHKKLANIEEIPKRIEVRKRTGGRLPLSFGQQRLWFLEQMDVGSLQYNMQKTLNIKGEFNIDVAEQAIIKIIQRHEPLRTVFCQSDLGSEQIIRKNTNFKLEQYDLKYLKNNKKKQRVNELIAQDYNKVFNLHDDLMLRVTYLNLGELNQQQQGVLFFNMHHIASDGWSINILIKEFLANYQAILNGKPDPFSPLSIQYVDFTFWQKELLSNGDFDKQLSYWGRQLSELPSVHNLALDYPRPQLTTSVGEMLLGKIPLDLTKKIREYAIEQNVTLFMLLHAALSLVLSRHSNTHDIIIGTPVANRTRTELESLIGFFVNTLVLRVDTNYSDFTDYLKHVKQVNLDGQTNQDVPFEQLVEYCKVPRSIQYSPLFQIMFTLSENHACELTLPEVTFTPIDNIENIAKFDFNIKATLTNEGIEIKWVYKKELFSKSRIESLKEHWLCLLQGIVELPAPKINELPMLSKAEIHSLIHNFNGPNLKHSQEKLFHELFEIQAKEIPSSTAVVFQDKTLAYKELNEKSNQLAHYLRAKGVKTETLVGIFVDRSLDMIISILAVLKSGGAYIALDTKNPKARIESIVKDTGIQHLLSHQELIGKFELSKLLEPIALDDDTVQSELICFSKKNPERSIDQNSSSLAYVTYTSGSTGQPKGVMVEHKSLCNYTYSLRKQFSIPDGLKYAVITSIATDLGNTTLFLGLAFKGILHLFTEDQVVDSVYVVEYMKQQQLDVLKLTPSHFSALFSSNALQQGFSCKWLFLGGEDFESSTITKTALLLQQGCNIFNHYGPTETTIGCTTLRITKSSDLNNVSIGRPLSNMQSYILSDKGDLLPFGVAGELYIGGSGVARGYLNQPELTEERFIQNPFNSDTSDRLYKTGDLVRYLPDGNIKFLGRVDDQIKVRGFRIEMGEIEVAISEHYLIQTSFVIAKEDDRGQRHIVAYMIPAEHSSLTETSLIKDVKDFLKDRLMDHMIPSVFMALDKFPLTINGKIDKNALPVIEYTPSEDEFVHVETETEKALAEIWAGLLKIKVEELSASANFFELGGDSILSIQVVSRSAQKGLHFTVKDLFIAQTIRQLAKLVKSGKKVIAPQNEIFGEHLLLPIQKSFFTESTDFHHYNQSVMLITPNGFNEKILKSITRKIFERHDALRLQFIRKDHIWAAHYLTLTDSIIENAIETKSVDDPSFKGISEHVNSIQTSLKPDKGSLIKLVYYHHGNSNIPGRLLMVIHHLVIDGVSWRVLLEDINTLYEQLQANKPLNLPDKTSSYQQWGDYLNHYATSDALMREQAFWFDSLNVPVASLSKLLMKSKTEKLPNKSAIGVANFSFNESLTEQLLTQSNKAYRTQINELLLAGLLLGVNRSCSAQTIRVDMEGHGREILTNEHDLSQTLGWFTTSYPLILSFSGNGLISELISEVKERYRAIPNKGLGFGVLKYNSQNEKFSNLPDSELLFNYLGQFDQVVNTDTHFTLADESSGIDVSAMRKASHSLIINGSVTRGCLEFSLTFDRAKFSDIVIQSLMNEIKAALKDIVQHCIVTELGQYTPIDFPLAKVASKELAQWQGKVEIADLYPATGVQQGLLYLEMLAPGSYINQTVIEFVGLDLASFKQAWLLVMQRHNVFRTAFVGFETDNVHQLVCSEASLPWRVEDLSQLDKELQQKQVELIRANDKEKSFDYSIAPLMRITVLDMGNSSHKLIWSYHHALLDGWCTPIVFREIIASYHALLNNSIPSLSAVCSYRDYAAWLKNQNYEAAVSYWSEQLVDVDKITPLPLVNLNSSTKDNSHSVHEHHISFSHEETERLVNVAKASHITMNILIQAAWGLLLSRYSGEKRVVFGSVTSGRPAELAGVEEIIGLFINSLPVVMEIDDALKVSDWLQGLHEQLVEREAYSYLPLTEIQQLSPIMGGLFESLVVYENYPIDSELDKNANDAALEIKGSESHTGTNYGITLVSDLYKVLSIKLEVKKHILSETDVSQLAQHLKKVLLGFVEFEDSLLEQVDILSDKEETYLLKELNETHNALFEDKCIHQFFEEQAIHIPDNIAVIFNGMELSYRELNHKSNKLAHCLYETGIEAGDCVGIYLDRSIEMLIAILAVMKSGGTYIPLDPSFPRDRVKLIIAEADIQMVLLNSILMEQLPILGVDILLMDDAAADDSWMEEFSASNQTEHLLDPNNLAYILYTSGSTGRPKGVMVPHRGVSNYLQHAINSYDNDDIQGSVVSSPLCFDATITTLLMPLCVGKSVLLLPEGDLTLPLLADYLFSDIARLFKVTPAHLEALAYQSENKEPVYTRHKIVIGGEQLEVNKLLKWKLNLLPEAIFVNEYGPTETVVGCSVFAVDSIDSVNRIKNERNVPIGRAIANTQFYVLGHNYKLLPDNSIGELFIGGAGVTSGYLNQSELTSTSFIQSPFHHDSMKMLYRTGDKVRRLSDGNLEFIGRIDGQEKIRGYRIELGEIEFQLNELENISQSIVLTKEEKDFDKKIIAYIIPKNDISLYGGEEIKTALKDKIPSYMIPDFVVFVESFPLTVNGKIDRNRLLQMKVANSPSDYVAPGNPDEEKLCEIFKEILNLETISVNDNFFALGGHSLMVIRLISSIRNMFEKELPLSAVSEHPTIAKLALVLIDYEGNNVLPKITKIDRKVNELEVGEI